MTKQEWIIERLAEVFDISKAALQIARNLLAATSILQGTVQSYDRKNGFYRVVYEDDDSEDVSAAEMERLVEDADQEADNNSKQPLEEAEGNPNDAETEGGEQPGPAPKTRRKSARVSVDIFHTTSFLAWQAEQH